MTNPDIVFVVALLCCASLASIDRIAAMNDGKFDHVSYKTISPVCSNRPECVVEFVGIHQRVMSSPPIWSLNDYKHLFPGYAMGPSRVLEDVLFVAIGDQNVLQEIQQSWGNDEDVNIVQIVDDQRNVTLESVRSAIESHHGKFSWYFLTEGPVIVFSQNLLEMIDGLDPKAPLAIGHVRRMHEMDAPLIWTGSGMAISSAAMDLVAGPAVSSCPPHHALSDTISSCFWERGVFIAGYIGVRDRVDPIVNYPGSMSSRYPVSRSGPALNSCHV